MALFRDMTEPASTDITQYPGYTKLSGEQQKKVAETYTNVFNNNQEKLGYRVAQGVAFETAKKLCESLDEAKRPVRKYEPPDVHYQSQPGHPGRDGSKSS